MVAPATGDHVSGRSSPPIVPPAPYPISLDEVTAQWILALGDTADSLLANNADLIEQNAVYWSNGDPRLAALYVQRSLLDLKLMRAVDLVDLNDGNMQQARLDQVTEHLRGLRDGVQAQIEQMQAGGAGIGGAYNTAVAGLIAAVRPLPVPGYPGMPAPPPVINYPGDPSTAYPYVGYSGYGGPQGQPDALDPRLVGSPYYPDVLP